MTRVLMFTGKGGVGKTTVAAATAARAAADGARVLVTSTDPAHSLADAFDHPLGDEPQPVAERLVAQQIDAMEIDWASFAEKENAWCERWKTACLGMTRLPAFMRARR